MYDCITQAQHLIQDFENEYAATMYVAKEARKILKSTNNALTESEAITWVLSGKPEAELAAYIQRHRKFIKRQKYSLINEYASKIDDLHLERQFRESAIASNKAHHLVIHYGELDASDSTRLRILLKQYWLEHLTSEIQNHKLIHSS